MRNEDVDLYIAGYDGVTKERLEILRKLAHKNIEGAYEKISYGVPTLCDKDGKYIAYFAGYDDFVSIYPVHLAELVEGIEAHMSGRSTARFYHNKPLPETMIEQLFAGLYESYKVRKK